MRTDARHAILPAAVLALSATAWVMVVRLGESPWGRWVHAHGGHASHPASAASIGALGITFVAGWVVMTIAMMLPTTLPLLQIFRRLTARRADRWMLLALVGGGYLLVWTLFGALVFGATSLLQAALAGNGWLAAHPLVPTGALLVVAGLFQFSPLKYRCLDKCRTPLSFVTSRWRGGRERWQSLRIGVDHGIFCVGCCWALMLLMLGSALASVLWMLAIGAVMAIEKNVSWGRRLSSPLGVVLLGAGAWLLTTS